MSDWRETLATWLLAAATVLVALSWHLAQRSLGIDIPDLLILALAILLVWGGTGIGVVAFQAGRFWLRRPADRRLRLAILVTQFGCSAGWYVAKAGQRVAVLLDPQGEDMFWDSYQVQPLVEDDEERNRILSDSQWWLETGLVFRNRHFGTVVDTALVAGRVFTDTGRVVMRGLYLNIDPADYWERIVLEVRRRRAGPKG